MIIDFDGSESYTTIAPYLENDPDFYKREVLKLYPLAYIRKTVEKYNTYQVCNRKLLFWHTPIGEKHMFIDQPWRSAYAALKTSGKIL